MEASSAGVEGSSSSNKYGLLELPPENLAQIVSYIPRKSLFPLLTVSRHFHQLASSVLYKNLTFYLARSDIAAPARDPAYRLADALHTFLTGSYDYAQHIKVFTLKMVENDVEPVQKGIAAKFLAREEAGMLLNTALLVMIRRSKGLEQFNWQVPIECSGQVYQALSNINSLQTLHIHFDVVSVTKHSYNNTFGPPPPGGPIFGGQTAGWWDPMSSGSLPPGSIPSTGTLPKTSKSTSTRSKFPSRKLGGIRGLHHLTISAIDDLSCLEEIAICLQSSSGSLKILNLSFAQSLVSKSQKPHPGDSHNAILVQEDDATTEPNSPDLNASASVPTELDLKREKQAQEQALARIFSLDKASAEVKKQDKHIEKSLKHSARSIRFNKMDQKKLDQLAFQILNTVEINKLDPEIKTKVQDLLAAIMPNPPGVMIAKNKSKGKKTKSPSASKKNKWHNPIPPPSMNSSKYNQPLADLWANDELDPASIGSNKGPSQFLPPLHEFGIGSNSTSNIPLEPPSDWADTSSLPMSSKPPKDSFLFNNGSYSSKPPKIHQTQNILPVYPTSSQSSYTFHPNPSSHLVNSVSHNSSLIDELKATAQQLQSFMLGSSGSKSIWAPVEIPSLNAPNFHSIADLVTGLSADANSSNQNHGPFATKKKKPPPANITPSDSSSDSSSESETESESSTVQAPIDAANNADAFPPLDFEFDMEHPDTIESDDELGTEDINNNEDEKDELPANEISDIPVQDDDNAKAKEKGKGKAKAVVDEPTTDNIPNGVSHQELTKQTDATEGNEVEAQSVEQSIQEYIRMTHGLSIEDLTLCFIPLKSSVLAKALDLTALKRVVFLNVGSQGAFWTMIEKLIDQGVIFKLQTLHTDDVSPAFVNCLGKLPGLKSLHLLRRSGKEFSNTSSKPPATLSDLHKIGLSKHFDTLQSLSITNLEDESWDFDDKIIRALSLKAKRLKELAFSVDSSSFHTFLRCLPGLKALIALHIISIKVSNGPSPMLPHSEWKKLLLDVICYYPSLKLKYVGIALSSQPRVSQIGEKPKMSVSSWYKKQDEPATNKDVKGKGKAPIKDSSPHPGASSKINNDSSEAEDERPTVHFNKTPRTSALSDSYVIYGNLVLRGRL